MLRIVTLTERCDTKTEQGGAPLKKATTVDKSVARGAGNVGGGGGGGGPASYSAPAPAPTSGGGGGMMVGLVARQKQLERRWHSWHALKPA